MVTERESRCEKIVMVGRVTKENTMSITECVSSMRAPHGMREKISRQDSLHQRIETSLCECVATWKSASSITRIVEHAADDCEKGECINGINQGTISQLV